MSPAEGRPRLVDEYATLVSDRRPARPDARHQRRSWERSLARWLPAQKDAAILDVGCGDGEFLAFLRERGYFRLWGMDSSAEQVDRCLARGMDFVRCHDALSIASLPGPEGGWDAVFCLDLLEHLPPDRTVDFLEQARRRLRTGGYLVVRTPNMAYLAAGWVLYGDPTHRIGYTELSLRAVLEAAGYERVEIRPHWYAVTMAGRIREAYLFCLHKLVYLIEGRFAPRVPTKNILARAFRGDR